MHCLLLFLFLCALSLSRVLADVETELSAIVVSVFGSDDRSFPLLHGLLGQPSLLDSIAEKNLSLYDSGNSSVVWAVQAAADDQIAPASDAAVVFLDSALLFNEEAAVYRVTNAIRSLAQRKAPEGEKKALMLVVQSGRLAERVQRLLSEAWDAAQLCDTSQKATTLNDIAPRIFVLNRSGMAEAVLQESVGALQQLSPQPLSALVNGSLLLHTPSSSRLSISTLGADLSLGQRRREAVAVALREVQEALSRSLSVLNHPESPAHFAQTVHSVMQKGTEKIRSMINETSVAQQVERDLRHQVFSSAPLRRLFDRQVALLRNEVAQFFNKLVTEELEVTIHVMDDLHDIRSRALSRFKSSVRALCPSEVPPGLWDAGSTLRDLSESLDDYVRNREVGFRLLGVLPRGVRKPVDISFHVFLHHPFGLRDHRQDVLALRSDDVFLFDEKLGAATEKVQVIPRAVVARQKAKARVASLREGGGGGGGRFANPLRLLNEKRRSEFAREMLMLPLSIKNPGVAMVATKRRRSTAPPKKDPLREAFRPERFIDWSLQPLDEVAQNLAILRQREETRDRLVFPRSREQLQQAAEKVVEEVADVFPALKASRYRHPTVNYGKAYSAVSH
eukprot:gene7772-8583_t